MAFVLGRTTKQTFQRAIGTHDWQARSRFMGGCYLCCSLVSCSASAEPMTCWALKRMHADMYNTLYPGPTGWHWSLKLTRHQTRLWVEPPRGQSCSAPIRHGRCTKHTPLTMQVEQYQRCHTGEAVGIVCIEGGGRPQLLSLMALGLDTEAPGPAALQGKCTCLCLSMWPDWTTHELMSLLECRRLCLPLSSVRLEQAVANQAAGAPHEHVCCTRVQVGVRVHKHALKQAAGPSQGYMPMPTVAGQQAASKQHGDL